MTIHVTTVQPGCLTTLHSWCDIQFWLLTLTMLFHLTLESSLLRMQTSVTLMGRHKQVCKAASKGEEQEYE